MLTAYNCSNDLKNTVAFESPVKSQDSLASSSIPLIEIWELMLKDFSKVELTELQLTNKKIYRAVQKLMPAKTEEFFLDLYNQLKPEKHPFYTNTVHTIESLLRKYSDLPFAPKDKIDVLRDILYRLYTYVHAPHVNPLLKLIQEYPQICFDSPFMMCAIKANERLLSPGYELPCSGPENRKFVFARLKAITENLIDRDQLNLKFTNFERDKSMELAISKALLCSKSLKSFGIVIDNPINITGLNEIIGALYSNDNIKKLTIEIKNPKKDKLSELESIIDILYTRIREKSITDPKDSQASYTIKYLLA